jgi:D-alanyl-D-alanine carboxypeptidase/D-alanyl-D-alanine-endopeptidase (penicillin-binding protein 4)
MNKFIFRRIILLSVLFCFLLINGFAQSQPAAVQQKINSWQSSSGLANAGIGICVSDTQTGEEIIKSEPQLSLVPASIMKVITTATALEVFGPNYRFNTKLFYSGIVRNDTLFGDLQIVGGGDPTLGSVYFPETNHFLDIWTEAIQRENIKVIIGSLIMDATIYESQTIPDTWVWEDMGNYYGAGASGISVFDNMYEIHLKSDAVAGKPTELISVIPEIPNLELKNEVLSSDMNSDEAYVFGSPMDNKRMIRGTIPKNQADFAVKASVPDPSALLAFEFRKKLSANHIAVSGITKYEKAKIDSSAQLSVIQSPTLKDIIRVTNHESVNLFAEHLLKHLAFQKLGEGTTREGCKFVVQFWKDKGLDMNGFFLNDGSGLSRFNAFTPNHMVNVLKFMRTKSANFPDFYQSLPSAGNGTLTVFSKENFPGDCLHAKSGSMTRVRCYAGYLTTNSGRQLSFAIMLNNFSCSQSEAIKKIEEVLVELRKE